jgi:hypothetical protein
MDCINSGIIRSRKMNTQQALAIFFVAGFLWGMVAMSLCCLSGAENTAGKLFQAETLSPDDDPDGFRPFIVSRLHESPAFRRKVVSGLEVLHTEHPKIYAEVMKHS